MTSDGPAPSEEQDYLASVSDVMSGLLFVFIITVVVFALALVEQKESYGIKLDQLTGVREEQRELLVAIERLLRDRGVAVKVDAEQGVVRLGEELLFASGRADLDERGRRTVAQLSAVFLEILPCYTSSRNEKACGNRGSKGRLDALFIEGHTDDQPLRVPVAGLGDNWDLSAARAKAIYRELVPDLQGPSPQNLDALKNSVGQPILGLSGYEARRPIDTSDTVEGRARNRRIDLRFIMTQPPGAIPAPARETSQRVGNGTS
ncbi:MAG: flagellar motor protein MotB [Vicinamibacterales bacterium]